MTSFLVHERMLCEVTFVRRLEADNIDEAYEAAAEGCGDLLGVSVGDAHPGIDDTEILEDAPHNMPAIFYPEPEANDKPSIETIRKEVGDDLYDSATNDRDTRSWLVDRYVASLSDEEVTQAWRDAGLDERYDEEDEE